MESNKKHITIEEKLKIFEDLFTHDRGQADGITLFPGIRLFILSTNVDKISFKHPAWEQLLAVSYCYSGRLGWEMNDSDTLHLGPGDFSVHQMDRCADSVLTFPSGSYEGLLLSIDLEEMQKQAPAFLGELKIPVSSLAEKFCSGGSFSSFSATAQSGAIFHGFFGTSGPLLLAYRKTKCLELLLYLLQMEMPEVSRLTRQRSELLEIVHNVHDYLIANIDQRITIDTLARQYLINPTTLKSAFKSVYGTSLAAHMKEHRMELAARMLRDTKRSISEIAEAVGYDSQSRFSCAFKNVYHILPSEYRKNHLQF